LERSLEMAVTYSDGLSDREAKLKEAKTTFKLTHRRTASVRFNCYVTNLSSIIFKNPTNYPRIQQQSSNSSDHHQKQQSGHQKDDEESSSSAADGSEDNEESQEEVENNEDSHFRQIHSKIII
jgi:hypothetical protein